MNQFYVSIIFLGVILILAAFVWIAIDYKKSRDDKKTLEDKKQELVKVIVDAEQMLEEMNRFSDYIVTQMELKNTELSAIIKTAEERVGKISRSVEHTEADRTAKEPTISGSDEVEVEEKPAATKAFTSDLIVDIVDASTGSTAQDRSRVKQRDKVIPLNSRYKEVLKMAGQGLDSTEIARNLNVGKGEIELILGINR